MSAAALLPPNAGAFEKALAEAMTDALPVPIREIMDPATTPTAFLPFLAGHRSVDLWFDDWPEARKRAMIDEAFRLAAIVGTKAAAPAFLAYVDAEIVHKVTHPARFVIGRSPLGLQPIGHKPFTTHYLIKVPLAKPAAAFVTGRTSLGRGATRTVDRTPLDRVNRALVVSKSAATAYSANFGWRRPITLDDGWDLDDPIYFDQYRDRTRL
ncbi:phage tail protein I [Afifella sp. H1R]|uniref:phage tail protein I n=1 Tax=Afifella sp. H1R TaxID=2908841 RepID=UPI001F241530|nr:phage tail protein I [Afifella sp. H1R]MCF1502906.1 phage tail protein I [Afifella sp. H1R]